MAREVWTGTMIMVIDGWEGEGEEKNLFVTARSFPHWQSGVPRIRLELFFVSMSRLGVLRIGLLIKTDAFLSPTGFLACV